MKTPNQIKYVFAAILSLAICGCRTIVKGNKKTDNINRYFWIPSSSGTVQHPIEVFDVHFCYYRPKEGNTYMFQYNYFGFFLKNGGLASGTNGIVYDENSTAPIPRYIAALWLSLPERQVYYIDERLPHKQIDNLFAKGYDYYDKDGKLKKENYDELDLCFLPKGKVVLYLKGIQRKTLIDWMGQGTATDNFNADICKVQRSESIGTHIDYIIEQDTYIDYETPVDSLLNKYFERFSYTINVDFADKQSKRFWGKEIYANGEELISRNRPLVESIAMPSRLKYYEVTWETDDYKYRANLHFCEEEMLRIFDEAYGNDRTQKGEFHISFGNKGETVEIYLLVGGKKYVFEKTEIEVTKQYIPHPDDDRTIVFKNYENKPQNTFRVK